MARFENMTNSIGTLLAVVISFSALVHTIWSDRQLRECDFLYSQNERLVELKKKINQAGNKLMKLRTEAEIVAKENDDDRKSEMVGRYIAQLLYSAHDIHEIFDLYQYAFPKENLEKIRMNIEEIKIVHDQYEAGTSDSSPDQFFSIILDKATDLYDYMKKVSDSEFSAGSDRLRRVCRN